VFVTLGVQHEMHMHTIVLASTACLLLPYFFHITSQTALFLESIYWT